MKHLLLLPLLFILSGCTGPMVTQHDGIPRIEAGFRWAINNDRSAPTLQPIEFTEIPPAQAGEIGLLPREGEDSPKMATWKKWAIGLAGAFAVSELTGSTTVIEDLFDSGGTPATAAPAPNTFQATGGGRITVKDVNAAAFRSHSFSASGPGSDIVIDFSE